jgi:multiple sugar transport system permease protein
MMVAPALALAAIFLFVPAIYVGWLSLHSSTYGQAARFVGLANYAAILGDRVFWMAFWNTFWVVNGVVYGELVLGLGLALLMTAPLRGKPLVIAGLIAPYAITEASAMTMWRFLLEPDVGLLSQALTALGLPQVDWAVDPMQGLAVASVVAIWHHLPFTFLILYAALATVPRELHEAASIDGAGPFGRFRHVTIPIILPAVLVAVLFRTIFAVRLFSEVWLLTEGGPARMTEVLSIYLYRATFKYHEFGAASATGAVMLLLSLVIASPYLWRLWQQMRADA